MYERGYRPDTRRRVRRAIVPLMLAGAAIFGIAYAADALAEITLGDRTSIVAAPGTPEPEPIAVPTPESAPENVILEADRLRIRINIVPEN